MTSSGSTREVVECSFARPIKLPIEACCSCSGPETGRPPRDVNRLLDVLSAPVSDIELLPLEDDDVVSLVHEYLGTAAIDDELKRAVLRLSDGLPFRTLEVLRTLTDEGVLLPYWGRWRLDPTALTRMHLPSETATILRRRIAALDGVTHSVMAAAAVIGVSFEEWLLVVSGLVFQGRGGCVRGASRSEAIAAHRGRRRRCPAVHPSYRSRSIACRL